MACLITGGAGFIGAHLAATLLREGRSVTVLDDLSGGSREGFEAIAEHPRLQFVRARCQEREALEAAAEGCDTVYHLAAIVGVRKVLASPLAAFTDNHAMTEAVLDVALRRGATVFLASSSEVYGKSRALPLAEDGDLVLGAPSRGRWAYAAAKLAGEHLALGLHRERGLRVVVGRLFNTTGPGQTRGSGMVAPTFVAQALAGRPITIIGDGDQTRCFTHVEDAVAAIIGLTASPACSGGVFNIGSEVPVSINDLAQAVARACGSRSKIVRLDPSVMRENFEEIEHRRPDISRIRQAIGWTPTRSLDMIIDDLIDAERKRGAG